MSTTTALHNAPGATPSSPSAMNHAAFTDGLTKAMYTAALATALTR